MAGFTGGCNCGAIRIEVTGEPVRAQSCHCDDCRKSTGAAYATHVFVNADDFNLVTGTPREYRWTAASGNGRGRAFCGDCGTTVWVWNDARPQLRGVRIGAIDDAGFVRPWAHVWTARALASTNLSDDLEKFEGQPPA